MNDSKIRLKRRWTNLQLMAITELAPIRQISCGDYVKISIDTSNIVTEETREFFRKEEAPIPGESLWVEITNIEGQWLALCVRGEIDNRPVLIDPRILRAGSPIEFTPDKIFDIEFLKNIINRRDL